MHLLAIIRLCVVCTVLITPCTHAHGSLREPPSRNVLADSNDCPQCLNGGGICGDARHTHDHEAGGHFARGKISRVYKSGSTINITLAFTANHMGRVGFKLCDLPDGRLAPARERALTTQKCFNRHVLRRTNGRVYSFIRGSEKTVTFTYRLPKNVRCSHCVIQWNWETGNSCCPAYTPKKYCAPGVDACYKYTKPEIWNNCADVKIK
jgi:hypothetical protein